MERETREPGRIFTFYSYKGGAGRSMTVANIACLLSDAINGPSDRALLVDWDLEAPGLHRFFRDTVERPENVGRPGVIDYFHSLRSHLTKDTGLLARLSSDNGEGLLDQLQPLDGFVVRDVAPGVDLMKAGKLDPNYPRMVGAFNWESFHNDFGIVIDVFRDLLSSKYAYCLIDSRTGLNDTSGLCTMLLPERLIAVFAPNYQSLYGLLDVVKQAVGYRQRSGDMRPLSVFPLPSRIELAEERLRLEWRTRYQTEFQDLFRQIYGAKECDLSGYFDEVLLPHVSFYAYGEEVAVRGGRAGDVLSLSRRYREFFSRLLRLDFAWERPHAESVSSAPAEIPRSPADFTGRETEIQAMTAAIEGGCVMCGMRGMGGIGKTALALKLAEVLTPRFPDGQLYVDLRGTSDSPLAPVEAQVHVIRAFDRTADISEDPDEVKGLYLSVLSGKRALLLMDNASGGGQIIPLVPPAGCALLVTSRQNFSAPGLALTNLDGLPIQNACDLLLKIAPRIGEYAGEIAELCGYLPLALRAAASLLAVSPGLSPKAYATRLEEERDRLCEIGNEGVEIGVEASLGLSYGLLTDETALALRQMAVFPGDFDAGAEGAVCEDVEGRSLSELERRSLAHCDPRSGRFRLHGLVRLFAAKRLDDMDAGGEERARTSLRYALHYLNVLRIANDLFLKGGEAIKRGLELFDLERENVRAGQAWAAANYIYSEQAAEACSSFASAWSVLSIRLKPTEYIEWTEQALQAARKVGDRAAEGRHLSNLGRAYNDIGEYRRSIAYQEQSLALADEEGDRSSRSQSLGNLGVAYYSLGEYRRAIDYQEQRLAIAREIANRVDEAQSLANLGLAYYSLGDYTRATDYQEQSLAIKREIGDRRGEGQSLGNLGLGYNSLGEYRRAIEFHEQALAIDREIGDRRSEGEDLGNLGLAYYSLGEYRLAVDYYEQRLAIAREIGSRLGEGNALWNMSLALDRLGAREQATSHAGEALKIYEAIEAPEAARVRSVLAKWRGRHLTN